MCKDKFIKNKKDHSGGFTLLGTLFSAFLAIIVIAAIASLSAQVYGSSRNSRDRFIAVGLAKEGIELVRNIRDGNWLYYPQPTDVGPVTAMQWRGEAGNTVSCYGSGANMSCQKSLCDGFYVVDALSSPDLGLTAVLASDNRKLKIDSNGFYTYISGTDTTPAFSRLITISTDTSDGLSSACGQAAESNPLPLGTVLTKPAPIVVTSTVSWEDPPGTPHHVELQESLYDWMMQRPS